jgi:hypothetical protein
MTTKLTRTTSCRHPTSAQPINRASPKTVQIGLIG